MRRSAALALVVLLAFGACSGDDDDPPPATVPTSASTSSTTAAPDVSKIPEVIDEAYLNAVLAALDEVDGQATRIIKSTLRFPPEAADLLNAIYSDEQFDVEANHRLDGLVRDRELKGIRPNPGNRRTTVERIMAASPECVWVAVRRDRSAVNFDPGPSRVEYVALRPLDRSNDPKGRNPTAWMMTVDGYRSDGSEPENPCTTA